MLCCIEHGGSMIIRTENWTKRNKMRKHYGFVAAIVYDQPKSGRGSAPACYQRLKVKEWAYSKLGKPALFFNEKLLETNSEWFIGVTKEDEYTIAFKNVKYRDWALLL
jgi:hypothetical protein